MSARHLRRELSERGLLARIEDICRSYNVTVDGVLSKKRTLRLVQARDACAHRLRTLRFSYPEIGLLLGLDHTTVMLAVKRYAHRDNGRLLG